jgi:effector-binding domain-containing protein
VDVEQETDAEEPRRETRYTVEIVAVPTQAVAVLRGRGPLAEIGGRMRRLREAVARAGLTPAGPMMARFYDDTGLEAESSAYDVCLPVEPLPDGSVPDVIGEARGELLPLHHVLQATHVGPHDAMEGAWRAVREALGALGYTAAGPMTEVYERGRESGAAPAGFVTLVRLPYAR